MYCVIGVLDAGYSYGYGAERGHGYDYGCRYVTPGTSQERTFEVMNKVDSLIAADPAVESRTAVVGFSFIGGQGPSYGSFIIKLKDWEERSMMQNSDIVYGSLFMRAQRS